MPIAPRSGVFIPSSGFTRQRMNPVHGTHNAEGKPYEVCPMCSAKASVRTEFDGDTVWTCEACGYIDSDKLGALN